MICKKVFLEILEISRSSFHTKTPVGESLFLTKLETSACNFIKKETLAQVFPCEFCEIFKNIFTYTASPVAATEFHRKIDL